MTLPDLLQSAAVLAVIIAVIAIDGPPATQVIGLIALILTSIAFIIKTDQKPWR